MKFELTILGSSGAMPYKDRFMTAQVLNVHEQLFLVDCGEGTQIRMSQNKIKRAKINHIFISHLHGDHVFGLPGLLTSYGMNMRKEPLYIYAPKGLKNMIDGLFPYKEKKSAFDIFYIEVDPEKSQLIYENNQLTVHSIPLKHSVPCNGFLFREKPKPRNMIKEKISTYQIPFKDIPNIKEGEDWISPDGKCIPNDELTIAPAATRSYAFCSDTAYTTSIIPQIKAVDLLYHEATFVHEDLDKAIATQHSTALQAAEIAQKANVGQLLIGHYSARYNHIDGHLVEAKTIFENTKLATDGAVFRLK